MADRARPLSITARLIIGLTLITTLLWCAAAGYAMLTASRELNETFDQTLQEAARRLLPLASDELGSNGLETDDVKATHDFVEGRKQYLSYQLTDANGRILLRSDDAPAEPYARAPEQGFSTVGSYRLYTTRDERTGMTITVAETSAGRWEAVSGGAKAMLLPLLALIPLSVAGIWLAVRTAMRPVLRLSEDIATRGGSNLAPLDISDQPRELRPIAEAVARLVDRLRHALDAERAFAATSAHELRTPIAGALALTQRLIAGLKDSADRLRARDIEQTLKRLAALAEKLMQLARLDAGVSRSDTVQDLLPALDLVVSDCRKRLDRPDRLIYVKPDGASLRGALDLDAFAMAARNLIDNAIVHGAPGGAIEVTIESGNVLRVVNEGPVVPATTLHGLKRRFARGETRAAGSGLGLAIVEQVMAQSGGRFDLASPAEDRDSGFEARLTLPG
jgi:two-component system OmpR family sensor kinase